MKLFRKHNKNIEHIRKKFLKIRYQFKETIMSIIVNLEKENGWENTIRVILILLLMLIILIILQLMVTTVTI